MRGFISDPGPEWKPIENALLVGFDLLFEPHRLQPVHSPMEERGLRACRASKPPHRVDRAFHKKFLYRPDRRELCPNLFPEVLEGVRVFPWEDGVTGRGDHVGSR